MAATLDGANTYFGGTLRESAWSGHTDADKRAAIKDASIVFQRITLYPRPPDSNLDNAVYEQALCLLETTDDMRDTQQNIVMGLTSATVSKHSESYGGMDASGTFVGGVFVCPNALAWVSDYMQKRAGISGRLRWCGDRRWHR